MIAAPAVFEVEPEFLAEVQRCYKPHCRYLRTASVRTDGETVVGTGEFGIGAPCYIDDTGHLNAVEVIICFNQLMYQTVATVVRHGLHPAFADWAMADFHRRYLPDILIAEVRTEFERPIDSTAFTGEFTLGAADAYTNSAGAQRIALHTGFRFTDGTGVCHGRIRLVVVDTGAGR
ncbi:FcoT family thioesterase [Nocardia sp. CDC159]|uniref:(2E)-enoyl-[ACP] glycyltransferase n=1 Tax=Nocardia pulmonis TaxID=2951408 RepID=A0A9X2E1K4_9NOCA|nr:MULTISPECIES: FcoT family thioesterase [Nocardia]MCM6772499.1 FcoT family thioesterase [Nocardia pulmonis]MCM6784843.1 FcoT family thioesterase [Nocardia sp. CDC159]